MFILKKIFLHIKYRIKNFLKQEQYKRTDQYKNLKNSKNAVVLLDTPRHGNLGDQAISLAEIAFVQNVASQKKLYEFSYSDCSWCLAAVKTAMHKDCLILVHGGGFIGSLWKNEHENVMRILHKFKKRKVIIFPQTIYFREEDKKLKCEFVEVLNHSPNLTLCVRERNSYNFLAENKVQCKYLFVPDIVLSLKPTENPERNGKVLLCFRSDLEKTSDVNGIVELLRKNNIEFDFTDTDVSCSIQASDREKAVNQKLEEFSRYSLVICDRLHAMIFSAITKTPCIAFDNISKKVSGVYEWIKDVEYIKCIQPSDFDMQLVMTMISTEHVFDHDSFMKNFDPLKEILNDENYQ